MLKGGNTEAALKFANFAIDPENNAEFNRAIAGVPVNVKSKAADEIQHMVFNKRGDGTIRLHPGLVLPLRTGRRLDEALGTGSRASALAAELP